MLALLGLGASLVAATQAILLPPSVSVDSIKTDGSVGLIDPLTHISQVPCIGCPYALSQDQGLLWVQGVENLVVLNISVGAQPETLELNGFRVYPPSFGVMQSPPTPSVAQVPSDVSLVDIRQNPAKYLSTLLRISGWSFKVGSAHTASDSGDEVLEMKMHISSIENKAVTIPDVTVTILKAADAKLVILNVKAEDASSIPTSPKEQLAKECKEWPVLCKYRAILASKLNGMKKTGGLLFGKLKGCNKGKNPHGMTHRPAINLHHGPNSHHDGAGMPEHHGMRPHHAHHHKHHGMHRFLHTFGRLLISIVIPVLIGVAVGMATYFVGMLIGCTFALLWAKVRGTRRGRYAAVPADEEEKVFVEAEYLEAPPVYEEVAEKEVVVE